ncbi:hypothetical protein RDWZM_002531 [Blomia tropicalis]|uniref:Potassium channel domain-containing protein n=1 Tax=Blomia tropicalis TaxID=40697 RepID=A0A9Q0RRP8_BLOTA|nr:hypothetical protein RDWZM_002531 [Blomia tropicalis]
MNKSHGLRFPTSFGKNSSSMYVFDPKTLATRLLVRPSGNVLEDTNSKLVSFFVWVKGASERWFSYLFILLVLIIYAFIGGAIFHKIEGDFEEEQNVIIRTLHEPIENLTDSTVVDMWRLRNRYMLPSANPEANQRHPPVDLRFRYLMERMIDNWEHTIQTQCKKRLDYGVEKFSETDEWNFMGSVFFSMTVFTTIGYGDKPPKTTAGKVAAMIYAFIGIPLLLIVLASFGKIFTKWIKYVLIWIRRLYYDRSLRSVRRMGRKATKAVMIQEAMLDAMSKMQRPPPFFTDPITGKLTMWPRKPEEMSAADLEAAASQHGKIPLRRAPRAKTMPTTTPSTSTPDTPMPAEVMVDFDDLDDEFNLPISLALTILMLYLFLGAIIFWSTENWTLFHSFYYVFISMTTIGFGDFVPHKISVLMYAFIYLLFGLALTSMCINVIQEKLSSTFERARLTIGETIGLDPSTPITIIDPGCNNNDNNNDKNNNSTNENVKGDGTSKSAPNKGEQSRPSTKNDETKKVNDNDKLKRPIRPPRTLNR